MKIKLSFDSDLCWHTEAIVETQNYISHEDVQALFPIHLGVPYNERDCHYEALDGEIVSQEEIYAYTE